MSEIRPDDWRLTGEGRMTDKQRKMLNAVCGDLSAHLSWHGNRLGKDDWRHMISGTILGWRMMPGIDRGEGAPGFIMLGGSSLSLSRSQAAEAIKIGNRILLLSPHPGQVKAELNGLDRTDQSPEKAARLEAEIHDLLFAQPVEATGAAR